MSYTFPVTRTTAPKSKPDPNTLKFGKTFTDHMLIMEYDEASGWHNGKIVPYAPLSLDPAAAVLHYAQEMFEGLKAYRSPTGEVLLFRPDMNAKRTRATNKRMCIPDMPEELFIEAVKAIVACDKDWIPEKEGTSLYIRPFIIADEPFLGVHAAHHYLFIIILSPVGPYYDSADGKLLATSIFVEEEYVRAVPGGTGFAKVGGNYAASLAAQTKAAALGCEQVLWLDAIERKYVEEIGTSNAFFVINGVVYTAPLAGTILPGVTRDSVINLLKKWGVEVREERLLIDTVKAAAADGSLDEIFATGTAAVISPVGKLVFAGGELTIGDGQPGRLGVKLYEALYGMQTGKQPDIMGWTVKI
jgi:branched-chain amino acid aminotransferase